MNHGCGRFLSRCGRIPPSPPGGLILFGRILLAFIILLSVIIAAITSAKANRYDELLGEYADAFRDALGQVDLTLADVTFDLGDRNIWGGDKYRLRFFDTLIENPFKIRNYVPLIADSALANASDLPMVIAVAQGRTGNSIRLGLIGDPLEPYKKKVEATLPENYLLDSISAIYTFAGQSLEEPERSFIIQKSAGIPVGVAKAVALFLYAMPDLLTYRSYALKPVNELIQTSEYQNPVETYVKASAEEIENEALEKDLSFAYFTEYLLDNFDFNYLNTGGELLAFVVKEVSTELTASEIQGEFSFTFDTPYGMIAVNGTQADTYATAMPYLIIVDAGGNDAYFGGAGNVSMDNPVSVLVDIKGNDTYKNEEKTISAFGGGVFGYGYLADLGGNDTYDSGFVSQGSGIFGVGVLLDTAGDDKYAGISTVQGAGTYGTGVLTDTSGNDYYECFQLGQGYGFTKGVGLLLDADGNDTYVANDTDIRYPSSQSKDHNSSLAQGCGFGRRSDYLTGHSWAGGVGMLLDRAGDDKYSSGVFGQGVGYWYGTGILLDKTGNDAYNGVWYVQGASAHFALGIVEDLDGNDTYTATMNMAQGAGHDFSIGWLHDSAGNDVYVAPNLSLGGGNANGIGIFWDERGDDSYTSKGTTLGKANPPGGGLRDIILCLGLFLDTGGKDVYPADVPIAQNDKKWYQFGEADGKPLPAVKGVGLDTGTPF